MKTIYFKKVALVGVGLIGGSLAKDLLRKKICESIVGIDISSSHLKQALREGFVNETTLSLAKGVQDADLVILATPVLSLVDQVNQVAPLVKSDALVIDVGSTKDKIVKAADKVFVDGNFVGCHPMAGREKSGPKASLENLFQDSPCLIVPGQKTKRSFVTKAKRLWKAIGSRPVEMPSVEHDRYVAACSHLPHVLSFCLMKSVGDRLPPQNLHRVAGPSFKSYTRIAGSDPHMWRDIFLDNQKATLEKVKSFKKELSQLEALIEKYDGDGLWDYIESSASLWRDL